MLQIPLEKVSFIIELARELDAKIEPWDAAADDDDATSILADKASDAVGGELAGFIADLNDDEQVELVALTWVGRGTFEPEEFGTAKETARDEKVNSTEDYLMGIPLLSDYLEEGVQKLGMNLDEV